MNSQSLTVLFADLVGSTQLYQAVGDAKAHQQITDSLKRMGSVIENHSGQLLKTVGDAVMASFNSADEAYLAAVDIQREHATLDLSVTVGFHFGEVIPDAGDVYGNSVNVASRVASFAQAKEICTTAVTVEQLSREFRRNTHRLDDVAFKGLSAPMAVYRVHWNKDKSATRIMTAVRPPKKPIVSLALDLQVGDASFRLNADNPLVTLGRDTDNTVVVDAQSVSRSHAKIELIRARYYLRDFSTNGTYITVGDEQAFVRRESSALEGKGCIGLGFNPKSDSQHVIYFNVSDSAGHS